MEYDYEDLELYAFDEEMNYTPEDEGEYPVDLPKPGCLGTIIAALAILLGGQS